MRITVIVKNTIKGYKVTLRDTVTFTIMVTVTHTMTETSRFRSRSRTRSRHGQDTEKLGIITVFD